MSTADFYDQFAPFYHLVFGRGLDGAIKYHSKVLDSIIILGAFRQLFKC